jgi:Arc/MetJ-type ribon-helix-helix transcriptional regulator
MPGVERVTVTLPDDLVREIDRREKNRSKFVVEAVRRELDRRRRAELRRSLQNPHSESAELAERGFKEWARSLPEEDTAALVDSSAGRPVRWIQAEGWVEGRD